MKTSPFSLWSHYFFLSFVCEKTYVNWSEHQLQFLKFHIKPKSLDKSYSNEFVTRTSTNNWSPIIPRSLLEERMRRKKKRCQIVKIIFTLSYLTCSEKKKRLGRVFLEEEKVQTVKTKPTILECPRIVSIVFSLFFFFFLNLSHECKHALVFPRNIVHTITISSRLFRMIAGRVQTANRSDGREKNFTK